MRIRPEMWFRPERAAAAFLLLAASVWLAAHAQFPPQLPLQSAPAAGPANCEISGAVFDAATGKPFAGAEVLIWSITSGVIEGVVPIVVVRSACDRCDAYGAMLYRLRTNSQGHFSVGHLVSGRYRISAVAAGYAEQFFQVQERFMSPTVFSLRPGEKRDDVQISLPRAAVLSGRVLDDHGQPVLDASVQVLQYGPPGARQKRLVPITGTQTDDSGRYRLFGLPPGRYYLDARYQPGIDLSSRSRTGIGCEAPSEYAIFSGRYDVDLSPLIYYPGVTDAADAKPIDVRAGQLISRLDISVRPMNPDERAQLKPARPLPPLSGDCQASGRILNAATGQPMRNTWVFLASGDAWSPQPGIETRTGADGQFDLRSLPCGWSLPLVAWSAGYVEQHDQNPAPPQIWPRVPPPPGLTWKIAGLQVALAPTAVITGRVSDGCGDPAACVHVVAAYASYARDPSMTLVPARETTTDDRGEYRFYGLPAGRYFVAAQIQFAEAAVTPPSTPVAPGSVCEAPAGNLWPYLYYPGATTPGGASVISLAQGQEAAGIDFSVQPVPVYEISGDLKGPNWTSGPRGVRLVLLPAKGGLGIVPPSGRTNLSGDSGHFRITGVPSGSYVLWAVAPGGLPLYTAFAPITVTNAAVTGVSLEPAGNWTVSGRLNVESQQQGYFRYLIMAQPEDSILGKPIVARDVQAGEAFELKGMSPGRYQITVGMLPENGFIKSATFGTQDVRTHLLEIPPQQPAQTLDLTVSWRGAQVQGTVVDPEGAPAQYATVVLAPEPRLRDAPWLFKDVITDPRGNFRIEGIPPGNYTLFTWDKVERGAWLDPAFLAAVAGHGLAVSLAEEDRKIVALKEIVTIPPAVAPHW
jgi:hypothetical protein